MLFIRFVFCLGVGLVGLCMVLLTVMETIFADWDIAHEFKLLMRRRRHFIRHLLDRQPEQDQGWSQGRVNAYGRPNAPQRQIEYQATSLPAARPAEPDSAEEPQESVPS